MGDIQSLYFTLAVFGLKGLSRKLLGWCWTVPDDLVPFGSAEEKLQRKLGRFVNGCAEIEMKMNVVIS